MHLDNDCDLDQAGSWLETNAHPGFTQALRAQTEALEYLWTRNAFVSESPENLYW